MKRHHEQTFLLYFSGFPGWLARFSPQMNNKMHFSLAKANNSANFERKMVWKWRFLLIHKQQTNMWMKLRTIPTARVSGQDRKITPALETNQIAGFGGFNPLASLEKNIKRCIPHVISGLYSPRCQMHSDLKRIPFWLTLIRIGVIHTVINGLLGGGGPCKQPELHSTSDRNGEKK